MIILIIFLIAFVCSPLLADDDLMKMIPAKSIFAGRINNFDYSLGQLDQFVAGVTPQIPMGVSMMVRMQLVQLFGNPALTGVNTAGNFGVFGVKASATNELSVFVMVPVANYKQFLEASPGIEQADANGVSQAAKGKAFMKQVGNYALLTDKYDRLVEQVNAAGAGGFTSMIDTDEMKQATTAPMWVFGNIQMVNKAFGPMIREKIEQGKAKMKKDMAAKGGMDMSQIMSAYVDILDKFLTESKSLTLAVKTDAQALRLTKTLTAVPATEMAQMLTKSGSDSSPNKLLNYLQDGAACNFALNVNSDLWKQLNEMGWEFMATIGEGKMSEENRQKMKKAITDFADAMGPSIVMTMGVDTSTKPPFNAKYVFDVKDKDKYSQAYEAFLDLWNNSNLRGIYEDMGFKNEFKVKKDVGSYKGLTIDSAMLTMVATDPNSLEGQMFNNMYGGGFDYRWAVDKHICLATVGADPEKKLKEMIDVYKAGGPKETATEVKAALELIPGADKADIFGTYNYIRLFKMAGAMMPMMAQMDFPTKSNLVFAGNVTDSKVTFEIALPKEHLTEMMAIFQMMMQMQMQQNMQQPGMQGAPPQPGIPPMMPPK